MDYLLRIPKCVSGKSLSCLQALWYFPQQPSCPLQQICVVTMHWIMPSESLGSRSLVPWNPWPGRKRSEIGTNQAYYKLFNRAILFRFHYLKCSKKVFWGLQFSWANPICLKKIGKAYALLQNQRLPIILAKTCFQRRHWEASFPSWDLMRTKSKHRWCSEASFSMFGNFHKREARQYLHRQDYLGRYRFM